MVWKDFLFHGFRAMLDFLMPRTCIVCGKTLLLKERYLCLDCHAGLPLSFYWSQERNVMGNRYNYLLSDYLPEYEPYSYAAALFFYASESPYNVITKGLKYHGNTGQGRYFASMLGSLMASQAMFADVDAVIPVPLHWRRRFTRGYNQAEVIARALVKELCLSREEGCGAEVLVDVLCRRGRTSTQTRLDASARFKNVSGAFFLRRVPECSHILLVDDVFTTGATLAACHLALRRGGYRGRISIATLGTVEK